MSLTNANRHHDLVAWPARQKTDLVASTAISISSDVAGILRLGG